MSNDKTDTVVSPRDQDMKKKKLKEVIAIEPVIENKISETGSIKRTIEKKTEEKSTKEREKIEASTPEAVDRDTFEASVAEAFFQKSTYSGKTYGIEDYNGDNVFVEDDDTEESEPELEGDWVEEEK